MSDSTVRIGLVLPDVMGTWPAAIMAEEIRTPGPGQLRALFVLVEGLIARFRYLDQTIAFVLGFVGVKLLTEDLVHLSPLLSFAAIAGIFGAGIGASMVADRRDPNADEKREQRKEQLHEGHEGADDVEADSGEVEDQPEHAV